MIKIPAIKEPQTPYVANMKALWEHLPHLAQELEMIAPEDLYECSPSKKGPVICKVEGDSGESIFTHSKYDPHKEANRWSDNAIEQGNKHTDSDEGRLAMCYFLDGFALGYHAHSLFEKLTGDTFLIISEPDLKILATAIHNIDYSEMLSSDRIIFITKCNREEIFNKLQNRGILMMLGIVFTKTLQDVNKAFHSEIRTMVTEFSSFMRAHMISALGNGILTCKNVLMNLPTYIGTKPINILKNKFKGSPAVIVSAGPSLQKNINYLKEIRDNVIVIAVQTTLKPLLAKGIIPDFVTSLDYHEISKRFFEDIPAETLKDIHLVAEPKATWHVIDAYRGKGPVSLLKNEIASQALLELGDNHDSLASGATVAHLAFYLAEYIGSETIIFIGQDLGYTNSVYYSPGNALHDVWKPELNRFYSLEMKEWERIARSRNILRQATDIHGNPIYTDEQMFTYLQQFEKDFAKTTTRVIDATEGGVKKEYCLSMTLKEASDQYCQKPIDKSLFAYRKDILDFDTSILQTAIDTLQKRTDSVNELKEISEETINIVSKMIELVDDNQSELNSNMIRLDELRTMVMHREHTYKFIQSVSQMAEMFRLREDRTIGIENIDGKTLQKRQLQRDVGYVTEIRNGCDRMLSLLDETSLRLSKEIENTKDN